VENVTGSKGDFTVTVRKKARYVNENLCTGCGACAEKCPTIVSDDYEMGLGKRKAIYRHYAQGIPSIFCIDTDHCRTFQGKKCGVCEKVCQAKAIDYKQQDEILELKVGAIILATGYDLFDATRIPEYGYGRLPNVINAMEFERLLSASGPTEGHVERPSDLRDHHLIGTTEKGLKKSTKSLASYEKKHKMSSDDFYKQFTAGNISDGDEFPKWAKQYENVQEATKKLDELKAKAEKFDIATRLAFIQCVGSRDFRFNKYCSSYCCMHSIKEAMMAKDHDARTEAYIFNMDLRTVGKGFEEYKVRGAEDVGLHYIRGRVAEITQDENENPVIWYEETTSQTVKSMPVDLAVLAVACEAPKGIEKMAELVGAELDENRFFKTHPLQPLDTTVPGIFVCGCAQAPMDIPESVAQASSAASRAAETIAGN
jgi:heterodisulfide reductase subunit A-like polyferredoxin